MRLNEILGFIYEMWTNGETSFTTEKLFNNLRNARNEPESYERLIYFVDKLSLSGYIRLIDQIDKRNKRKLYSISQKGVDKMTV